MVREMKNLGDSFPDGHLFNENPEEWLEKYAADWSPEMRAEAAKDLQDPQVRSFIADWNAPAEILDELGYSPADKDKS